MRKPFKIMLGIIVAFMCFGAVFNLIQGRPSSNDSAAASDESYPAPDTFIERWNVLPTKHERDDQNVMFIHSAWAGCRGSDDHDCLAITVCDGSASIHAVKDTDKDTYTYVYTVNQFASNSLAQNSCMTGVQRLFNTLYDSPDEAQKAIMNFFGVGKSNTSTNYSETVEGTQYDVRVAHVHDAFVKCAMASIGRDSTPSELIEFWRSHYDICILSKADPTKLRP